MTSSITAVEAEKEKVMFIVFVRHGHPNYKLDCLTELGHNQAAAAAERLADEGIEKLYASPLGRAQQTAGHIAERLGLEIETLPFMREIGWGAEDGSEMAFGGHPWYVAWDMAARGQSLTSPTFADEPPFAGNRVVPMAKDKAKDFDALLRDLGYTREGDFYRVGTPKYKKIAVVSHAGSSTAVIAHMLNWPLPLAYGTTEPECTAITTLLLSDEEGKLCAPKIRVMNDARHIFAVEGSRENCPGYEM